MLTRHTSIRRVEICARFALVTWSHVIAVVVLAEHVSTAAHFRHFFVVGPLVNVESL